jgi:hypothetical protein
MESMAEIKRELIEYLADSPATDEEINKVKSNNTLSLPGRWETASAVLRDINEIVTYDLPDDYWDTYADSVRNLSAAQIVAAADAVIKPENLMWVRSNRESASSSSAKLHCSIRTGTNFQTDLGYYSSRPAQCQSDTERIMTARIVNLLFLVFLFAVAAPASGHHSFAAVFDADSSVEVSGTVTKLDWRNPHAWIYLDVVNDDGGTDSWSFEMGSVNGLIRRGWSRNSVKPGDEITISGYRARDGSFRGNVKSITLPNGQQLDGMSSRPTD